MKKRKNSIDKGWQSFASAVDWGCLLHYSQAKATSVLSLPMDRSGATTAKKMRRTNFIDQL